MSDDYPVGLYKLTIPKNFAEKQRERCAQRRRENFKNIILRTPLVEFSGMATWCDNELETIGVQWFSGINKPSAYCGYPDQVYWQTFSLIFMFRDRRWCLTFRGHKMPYKNYDEYVVWRRKRWTRPEKSP